MTSTPAPEDLTHYEAIGNENAFSRRSRAGATPRYPEGEEREVLTFREERVIEALKKERTVRKAAEREARDLHRYKSKYYEARDRAELWESRAIRYSERLKTMTIKAAANNTERA